MQREHALTIIARRGDRQVGAVKDKSSAITDAKMKRRALLPPELEELSSASADVHFQISSLASARNRVSLKELMEEFSDDPAYKVRVLSTVKAMLLNRKQDFVEKLKTHLFRRLREAHGGKAREPTSTDVRSVRIMHDRVYTHKTMRINYDTYDMHRDQDTINPDSHADIMMRAQADSEHPYLYARVLSIFHMEALLMPPKGQHVQTAWQTMHVCFVRWFEVDLPKIRPRRLIPLRWATKDEDPFGFVAPDQVLRGCHLLPSVVYGRSDSALRGYSEARNAQKETDNLDYNRHYVGQYAGV